jgi:hypothetical protein
MDGKDWLLVVAALVIFGGPLSHALWKRAGGQVTRQPQGDLLMTTDTIRLGTAVTSFGGKAIAEGAKLTKYGASYYNNTAENKANQKLGGE